MIEIERLIVNHDNEKLIDFNFLFKNRLTLLVDENYMIPDNYISKVLDNILNMLYSNDNTYIYNIFGKECLKGELDITIDFNYEKTKLSYNFNYLNADLLSESVFIDGIPACLFENTIGQVIPCEKYNTYTKLSGFDKKMYFHARCCTLAFDKLFIKLMRGISQSLKSDLNIHDCDNKVKRFYEYLIPKLGLGIEKVMVGKYSTDYIMNNGIKMELYNLGSGMNSLARLLPKAIDAVVNNRTYFIETDGLMSVHPALKRALILLFNRFKRGNIIMNWSQYDESNLEYYGLNSDNITKLHLKSPETLIFE